jgi:hypothetical protein
MPGGTLRVDSNPRAGARLKARVPLDGWKVWRIGLRHSVYVVSECDGSASARARSGSPPRWVGSLTKDGHECHARERLGAVLVGSGDRPGPAGPLSANRSAEDQPLQVRRHGVLRSSYPRSCIRAGLNQVPPMLLSTSLKASGLISTDPENGLLNSPMVNSMPQTTIVSAATMSACARLLLSPNR